MTKSSDPSCSRSATVAAAMMVYFLVPQVLSIPREPHLGRAWIATLLRRPDKQANWRMASLLS